MKGKTAQPEGPETEVQSGLTEAEAAFSAGYYGTGGDEKPPVTEVTKEPEQEQVDPQVVETQPPALEVKEGENKAEVTEQAKELILGMSEDQLKSLLAQVPRLSEFRQQVEHQMQQVFGRFGDIQRQLQSGALTSAEKRELKADAFKALGQDYPELTELLAKDLSQILSQVPVPRTASAPDMKEWQDQIQGMVRNAVSSELEAENERLLDDLHSDWKEIAKSDDLQLWLSTQAPQYVNQFKESNSAAFVSRGLDRFKEWRKSRTSTQTDQTEEDRQVRQKAEQRLRGATPPKGRATTTQSALSDMDAFIAGWNQAGGSQRL